LSPLGRTNAVSAYDGRRAGIEVEASRRFRGGHIGAPIGVTIEVPLGDGLSVVGAPSLDRGHNLVHIETEAGVFHAVSVPLP